MDAHDRGSRRRRSSNPLLRGVVGLTVTLALALPSSVRAQETRVVSGVVEDAENGAPVSDAVVTIPGTGLSAVTDQGGRFELAGVPVGSLQLMLRHVAYGEQTEPLEVGASGALDFRIRISTRAIELEPLGVEVTSPERTAQRALGTAGHVIDRATIEAAPPGGQGLLQLLQSRIPSLRVLGSCVEYRYLQHAAVPDPVNPELLIMVPCRDITVYLDGAPYPQGSALLQQLPPEAVERIQVLSPAEAGLQYAAGSRGVILVETRRGVVAEGPYRVHVNGFGWDEPESYPWLRVLGVSALGNALVWGIASNTFLDCDGTDPLIGLERCHDTGGIAAGLLTGAMSPLITGWAGRTPYSEGRTYPTLLMAAATASAGYLLYVRGVNQDSDASRAAGRIILAAGVPLTLTFSNRLFRMLR